MFQSGKKLTAKAKPMAARGKARPVAAAAIVRPSGQPDG